MIISNLEIGPVTQTDEDSSVILKTAEPFTELRVTPTATHGRGIVVDSCFGQVTEHDPVGMYVKVSTGGEAYNHQGKRLVFPEVCQLTIATADADNTRKDIVVVTKNNSVNNF